MSEQQSLNLRKMTKDDLPKVMQGECESYPHPWTQKNFEDCLASSTYSCWVFESSGNFSGHLILSSSVDEAHILNLCIYPQAQGKGWGRKLLAEAEQIARQQQAKICFLEVRPSNIAGKQLYQSAGYNEIGRRKDYYPATTGREDAVVMAKTLF